jgi:menaquinone-dependent protoporphyrinogen IX oxidase
MKTVVIYKSLSGFTKKYAEWISEEIKADIYNCRNICLDTMLKYDLIIYGGSLHAAGISGVNIIKKNLDGLSEKKIIIFTTGASPSRYSIPIEIRDRNFTTEEQKQIRFFYFRGGFDFNKLDLKNKFLMKLMKWSILLKHKKNRTPDEKGMLAAYSKPVDFTKKENIKGLLEYVRSLK